MESIQLDLVIDKTNCGEAFLSLVSWHPIDSGSLMNSIEKRIRYETQLCLKFTG